MVYKNTHNKDMAKPRLTDEQQEEIRQLFNQRKKPKKAHVAERYGVCYGTIRRILQSPEERRQEDLRRMSLNKSAMRRNRLKCKYGMELEEYDALFEAQSGCCAICSIPVGQSRQNKTYFDIDHCHETGRIRGLLCSRCNSGLGCFKDTPALLLEAIKYLEKQ